MPSITIIYYVELGHKTCTVPGREVGDCHISVLSTGGDVFVVVFARFD